MMFSFFKNKKIDYAALLKRQVMIIDVRTTEEFETGHADLSRNIPLGELPKYIVELQRANRPIVTCCKVGLRSASAMNLLKRSGLEAYNGGTWKQVQKALN